MIKYVVIHNYIQLQVTHNGYDSDINRVFFSMWLLHMGYGKMDEIKILDGESALKRSKK